MITETDLARSVTAGSEWVGNRDLPDCIGWADFVHSPGTVGREINRRLGRGIECARVHPFPLPKGYGPANRTMAVADPLDEVLYRTIVAGFAEDIESSLGPEVKSYRLSSGGTAWTYRDHRYGHGVRRREARAWFRDAAVVGIGTLDVRSYYPSIRAEALVLVLSRLGARESDLRDLQTVLESWQGDWGVRGVPIGPEASGLLGNAMLMSVDQGLRDRGVRFSRYSDDYWIELTSAVSFGNVVETVSEELDRLGLALNPDKVRELAGEDVVLEALTDSVLDDLALRLKGGRRSGLNAAIRILEAEVEKEVPKEARVRYCLAVLKNAGIPIALRHARGNPRLMRIDPRGWGRYVREMARRGEADLDWLVEVSSGAPTPDGAAVQLHMLLACASVRLPGRLAEYLEPLALEPHGTWVPIRCAAAEAWGASERARLGRIVEATMNVGDFQHKRALTLTMRRFSDSPRRRAALKKIGVTSPASESTLAWISAGAPNAA